ncbi:MAG: efflux RND transporter periplasmic adaptor subunit [Marinilabiliaceae bacterium]
MRRKTLFRVIGALVLIGAVLLAGYAVKNKPAPQKSMKQKEDMLYVKAAEVTNEKATSPVTHQGRISSYETVSLASEVNGRIMEGNVDFKEGGEFNKGDLLIRIYDEDIKATLTAGRSNFLQKLSSVLPDLQVDFPDEYDKWKQFFTAIKVQEQLPELPETHSEKEQVFMASAGILSEYYSLEKQEIDLSKYQIYAPFDGSFRQLKKQVGSVAGMGTDLASIVRTDRLEVVVPVPPNEAKWIEVGNKVTLTGPEGHQANGTVTRIAGFLDENTQSVNVYVKYLPREMHAFSIGEFVDATFDIQRETRGMAIPREALIDGERVYVVKNRKLQIQKVSPVRTLNDTVVISGLTDGSMVVVESLVDVQEGDEVKIRQ